MTFVTCDSCIVVCLLKNDLCFSSALHPLAQGLDELRPEMANLLIGQDAVMVDDGLISAVTKSGFDQSVSVATTMTSAAISASISAIIATTNAELV